MANPTSNFGWQMPTNTDLVKDLPADFETFGQAVDTSMADLKGGTTGQILSKNSNTDMDFIWINNDQGDITGVTASSPLTGGGTSGAITVGIQSASTTQSGAVQLTDSTSSTSTTTAATPNSVKSAYDLAGAAIPKSTVTTNGDLIYGTGSATVTRLGIGSTGQVLTVASGVPSWATASGGDWVKITKQTASGVATATLSNVFSATYDIYKIFGEFYFQAADSMRVRLRTGSTNSTTGYYFQTLTVDGTTVTGARTSNTTGMSAGGGSDENRCSFEMMIMSPYLSDPTKFITQSEYATTVKTQWVGGIHDVGTSYESCQFYGNGGQNIVGTFYVYGLKA